MAQGDFVFSVSKSDYEKINAALKKMGNIAKSNVLRQSFKQGSTLLITSGKSSFLSKNKKKTGNLYKSFTDKINKKKKSGVIGIYVGFRRGKGKGNHSHLIDRGTTDRYTQKGYYRGKIDAAGVGSRGRMKTGKTYFWTNTVEDKGTDAMEKVTNAIYTYLNGII